MKTKCIAILLVVMAMLAVRAEAQFRQRSADEPSAAQSFVHPPTSEAWLGFFNPENFTMHQSYSMSYSAFGSQGVALGRFTNTMDYKISEKLDVRAAVSLQHSPYSTLPQSMQNSMTGIFLDRAELNYRPTDNMFLRVSFRQMPAYAGYGYGYYSPFMTGATGFDFEGY